MKPQKSKIDYEKVVIGEMLKGTISDIKYDMEHRFKGFQGKEDTIAPAVRFTFSLDGYRYPHYSRFMRFSYGAKSNLYTKYLVKLVEGATPDFDFDLDLLKGMKIKTIWSENGDFQNLDTIYPDGPKVKADTTLPEKPPIEEEPLPEPPEEADESPF